MLLVLALAAVIIAADLDMSGAAFALSTALAILLWPETASSIVKPALSSDTFRPAFGGMAPTWRGIIMRGCAARPQSNR